MIRRGDVPRPNSIFLTANDHMGTDLAVPTDRRHEKPRPKHATSIDWPLIRRNDEQVRLAGR